MKHPIPENLSEVERDRFLHELGIAEEDVQKIIAGRKGAEVLLPQRLEQAGLDPEAVRAKYGGVMRDMERLCSLCGEQKRCVRDLDRHVAERLASYCPNTTTIDSLTGHH